MSLSLSPRPCRIWGWGLNAPEGFRRKAVGPPKGCANSGCAHNSHDPAERDYELVPESGEPVRELGRESFSDAEYEYFAVGMTFLRVAKYAHHWAEARIVPADDVPEYMLPEVVA